MSNKGFNLNLHQFRSWICLTPSGSLLINLRSTAISEVAKPLLCAVIRAHCHCFQYHSDGPLHPTPKRTLNDNKVIGYRKRSFQGKASNPNSQKREVSRIKLIQYRYYILYLIDLILVCRKKKHLIDSNRLREPYFHSQYYNCYT